MLHKSGFVLLLATLMVVGNSFSAHAQSDGEDEQEKNIPFSALPNQVQDAFNSSTYADWRIEEVEKAPSAMGTKFEVEVKNTSDAHLGLYYNKDGQLVRKEDETMEEEDNDEDPDDQEQDDD